MTRLYTENGKFYMDDNGIITELTNIKQDKKRPETGDYIVLPKNSANCQYCKCHYITKTGEYILKDKLPKDERTPATTKTTETHTEYLNSIFTYLPEDIQKEVIKAREMVERQMKIERLKKEKEIINERLKKLDEEIEKLENPENPETETETETETEAE